MFSMTSRFSKLSELHDIASQHSRGPLRTALAVIDYPFEMEQQLGGGAVPVPQRGASDLLKPPSLLGEFVHCRQTMTVSCATGMPVQSSKSPQPNSQPISKSESEQGAIDDTQ
jgi:hypothetical protein